MKKPNNYENTQAQGEFTPVELGGHSLTIHLQNHYDRPFDRIRVGNKAYGVDFSRKLRTKQVYVVSEVV